MAKHAKVLWVDLEMTGLSPVEDKILEVAAVATDWDFHEVATFEAVVKVDPGLVDRRMKNAAEFWDKFPEVRDALVAQNDSEKARDSRSVENDLLVFINQHFDDDGPVLLGGNSIHQDRKFIESEWSRINTMLNYRMLDVSAWKVVFEGKYGKKFAKPEAHRALDDVRGSIQELQYYLGKVRM